MPYSSNTTISGLEAKATPVDADVLVVGDSADTNRAKKTTWAQIKTVLSSTLATIASPTFTGTVTTPAIIVSSETASTVAHFDASKNVKSLALATYPSLTELSYVKGVTSALQTQITAKAPSTAPTFATSITTDYLTASEMVISDGSKKIVSAPVATYPSLTELTYLKGVTSAIQTQIAGISNKLDLVYTDVTSPSSTVETALYTKLIPANTLGTGNGVRLKIYFDTFEMTSNGTFTWRFKYGSTTVATITVASTTISSGKGYAEFILLATGATTTQEGYASLLVNTDGVGLATVAASYSSVGTSAETSTGALNLVVTTESQNTGTLSGVVTLKSAILEKIA